MQRFEYKVVPAPKRGEKARGAKTTSDRFAVALMTTMNTLGRDGWEYVRADTLPCEERVGLTGKTSAFHHMLVFRRALPQVEEVTIPPLASAKPTPTLAPIPDALFEDFEADDVPDLTNVPKIGSAKGKDASVNKAAE